MTIATTTPDRRSVAELTTAVFGEALSIDEALARAELVDISVSRNSEATKELGNPTSDICRAPAPLFGEERDIPPHNDRVGRAPTPGRNGDGASQRAQRIAHAASSGSVDASSTEAVESIRRQA
jgi:hypothetical protein